MRRVSLALLRWKCYLPSLPAVNIQAQVIAFKHEIHTNFYEMDARKRMLTCEYTDHDIDLATIKYNARIVTKKMYQDISVY